jgi:hypothetical protein
VALVPRHERLHEGLVRPVDPSVLLTSCSRRNDTRGHRTTSDDAERHVERGSVRSASNLRIRWPRGRGSSSLPSRTALTSGDAIRIVSLALHRARSCSRIAHARMAPDTWFDSRVPSMFGAEIGKNGSLAGSVSLFALSCLKRANGRVRTGTRRYETAQDDTQNRVACLARATLDPCSRGDDGSSTILHRPVALAARQGGAGVRQTTSGYGQRVLERRA